MSGGFEVSTTELTSSADQLKQIADEFRERVSRFQSDIAGQGEPWGADDIGMLIGIAHGAVLEAAMECFQENARELGERAEELRAMADNYTRMEEANTLTVNTISQVLG